MSDEEVKITTLESVFSNPTYCISICDSYLFCFYTFIHFRATYVYYLYYWHYLSYIPDTPHYENIVEAEEGQVLGTAVAEGAAEDTRPSYTHSTATATPTPSPTPTPTPMKGDTTDTQASATATPSEQKQNPHRRSSSAARAAAAAGKVGVWCVVCNDWYAYVLNFLNRWTWIIFLISLIFIHT